MNKKGPPSRDKRSEDEKYEDYVRQRAVVRGISVEGYKRQKDTIAKAYGKPND